MKWTRFERMSADSPNPQKVAAIARASGRPFKEAWDVAVDIAKNDVVMANNLYQVHMRKMPPNEGLCEMIHLSIRRQDRAPIHDWRHLQRIKNELVGRENEGIELYPAESRLVDGANQFHLWVCIDPAMRFPVGWTGRLVYGENAGGAVQRPFEEEQGS